MDLDTFIKRRGGIFEPDTETDIHLLFKGVDGRFEEHQHLIRTYLYSKKPRPVRIEILNDSRLNAVACVAADACGPVDFIGINAGVVFTLWDVFSRMLAHPGTFADVGNPGGESPDVHTLPHLNTNALVARNEPLMPRCPTRQRFALELTFAALDFLFFHELSHLREGHVDYLRDQTGFAVWQEAHDSAGCGLDARVSQALEAHADAGGAFHALNEAYRFRDGLHTMAPTTPAPIATAMRCAYATGKLATRTVTFATYVLFRIFDVTEWAWWQQAAASHPLPPFRMYTAGQTIRQIFRQHPEYGYEAEAFASDHLAIIHDAELACGFICSTEADFRSIRSVIHQEERYLDQSDELARSLDSLYPVLEKYRRG